MTQQINTKFIMIWWEQWELTRWNSLLTPSLKNLSGTLFAVMRTMLKCVQFSYFSSLLDSCCRSSNVLLVTVVIQRVFDCLVILMT